MAFQGDVGFRNHHGQRSTLVNRTQTISNAIKEFR